LLGVLLVLTSLFGSEDQFELTSRVVQHARGVLNCTPGACNFTCFGRVTPCTPRILGA